VAYSTTVYTQPDGSEVRIIHWADGRKRFNAMPGVRTRSDLIKLRNFFSGRAGKGHSFPARDLSDFEFVDTDPDAFVQFATYATGTSTYQLVKQYGDAAGVDVRAITKPELGTVQIRWGGGVKTEGTHYSINYLTGVVTILVAPANGTAFEVAGQFWTPCRFIEDELPSDQVFYHLIEKTSFGQIPTIGMIEVKGE